MTDGKQQIKSTHHSECECPACRQVIPLADIKRFVKDCFCSIGVSEINSEVLADSIVQADYRGVFSEGVLRLESYIREIQDRSCDPKAEPTIESEFTCTAVVNGKNGLGPVIGKFCMDLAVRKATSNGIAMVVAKGSNYYGMASMYTMQALKKGFIGLSFTNGVPRMVPPGASQVALGMNPISLAAPADCDALVTDMSSTAVTLSKIEEFNRKGVKLPKGWALNKKGQAEDDAQMALGAKMLSPLGGEQCHKGYGLAIAVEALSGVLADASYGSNIAMERGKPPNLGHGFIAINPEKFTPDFGARLSNLLNYLRKMEPADTKNPVLVPGDPEFMHMKKVDNEGGVSYSKTQLKTLEKVSKDLNVEPPEQIKQVINKISPRFECSELPSDMQKVASASEVNRVGFPSEKRKNSDESKASTKSNQHPITPVEEARRFMVECLMAVGIPQDHAEIVADNLVEADYRGYYSHGMNRLDKYIKDIQDGICDGKATCTIEKETVATAVVNGNNGLGAVIGQFCMDLAMQKAKDAGIAMVVAHGSNHFGITQYYPLQAVNQGLLGMAFTNTSPYMVPTRAKEAALGTNPLSLGAPALNGDSFILDITTTAVALGKIELCRRKHEPIMEGWALNDEGKVETDPDVAYKAGKLLPIGGTEMNAGYKGYSLGLLVELFSGILSGSKYGPYIRKWGKKSEVADLGQAFIAINPKCFAAGFEERMNDLMSYLRNMEPLDPNRHILIHGDIERMNMEQVKNDGGFTYVQNQHDTNAKLAEQLKVKPIVSKMPS